MHSCPHCGQACYCGGDIDDIDVGYGADACDHCEDDDIDDEELGGLCWKAGFHEGANLHLCDNAQSTRAKCGMPITTDRTEDDPKKEECCAECWTHYIL